MKCIFEAPMEKKSQVMTVLEADPYGEAEPGPYHHVSFARNGYKTKDGVLLGEDKEKTYVFLRGADEFLPFAQKKLAGLAARCAPEVEARVMAKFEEEEGNAEVGMGAIFG